MDGLYREEPSAAAAVWRMLKKKYKCDRKLLFTRFPVARWLPRYKLEYIPYDFIAGLTVALTAIPQGIAYAVLAGLPPQYGLYSEIMPGIMYMVFGSTRYITIGPTAIMALMIQPYVALSPAFAALGAFMTGLIILLLGVLNLGFIVEFISLPVTVGFTAAAALSIGSSQVKSLLGLTGGGNQFLDSWINIFKNIDQVKLWDTLLGVSTIIILISLKKFGTVKRWPMATKYTSLSRNAIVVILGTLLAFLLKTYAGAIPFNVTGQVASGLPPFKPPPFDTQTAEDREMNLVDMLAELSTSLMAIPIVAILEMVAVAKAFSHGNTIDASQELIALGMSSMMGSFVSGMPVTGSFTRTALNDASGVRTQFGGIFTSVLVLAALGLLTNTFYFIPKAVLAAVIIVAVLSMIEYHLVAQFWRTKKIDLIPLFITLIACLFLGLDYGIVVGVTLNILFILQTVARPHITAEYVQVSGHRLLIVTPDQSLFFASSEFFRYKVTKWAHAYEAADWIVINGHHVQHLDATVAIGMMTLIKDLAYLNKKTILWKWNQSPMGVLYRTDPELVHAFNQAETIAVMVQEVGTQLNGTQCLKD